MGKTSDVGRRELAVYVLTVFFGLQALLAGGRIALGFPLLTSQSSHWRMPLIYGGVAAYVAYLCWRRSPRARFAAYIFLTVDVLRGIWGAFWWTIVIDLAVLGLMQMPAFRRAYPSIRPGDWRGRRAQEDAGLSGVPGLPDRATSHGRCDRIDP